MIMPMSADPVSTPLHRAYAVIRLVLLAGIVSYLGWEIATGWGVIRTQSIRWNAAALAGAVVSGAIAYQGLFVGWILLLRRTGHFRQGQYRGYAHAWWHSFLYRYVPGKVMLLVERARLGSALGIPPAAGGMLTIIETLLSLLAGATVSLLAILYYAGFDPRLTIGVGVVAVGTIFLFPPAYRRVSRLPAIRQRFPDLESLALNRRDILLIALPYVAYYLLLGLSLFLFARILTPLPWTVLPGLCGIYALSHVVSLLAVLAPAGLGVREGTLAVQLSPLLPQGMAGVLAIAARLWFTLIELGCYLVFVLSYRSQDNAQAVSDE
jgi:hypothetical protein